MSNNLNIADLVLAFRQIKNICQNVLVKLQNVMTQSSTKNIDQQSQIQVIKKYSPKTAKNVTKINEKIHILQKASKKLVSHKMKPKAPLTPYFLFFNKKRDHIHTKFPHLNQVQMANVAGQVWRSLTPEEKQPFQKQYNKNKLEYNAKILKFYQQFPQEIPLKYKRRMSQTRKQLKDVFGDKKQETQECNILEEQNQVESEQNDSENEGSI